MASHEYIEVADAVLAEFIFQQDGLPMTNTMSFERETSFDDGDMNDLAEQLSLWHLANILPPMSSNTFLDMIRITDLRTQSGAVIEYTTDLHVPGDTDGDRLPMNCAIVVTFRTNKRGRSFRGRNYLGGLVDIRSDDNHLTQGYVDQFDAGFNLLDGFISSFGWAHVVVSRFQNGAWLSAGVTTPVTSYTLDTRIDTQRKRLP